MRILKEEERGAAYGLLSFLFLYPRENTLDYLASEGLEALAELSEKLALPPSDILDHLRERLKEGEAARNELLLDLQRDYTRLFINAYPKMVAPPYSSVYLDGKGKVWGESTSWVNNLYREAGLEIADEFHNLPDHIAAELAFASHLLGHERNSDPEHAVMYEDFLRRHLLRWTPPFLKRVKEGARQPFYALLAELLVRLLAEEENLLQ